MNLVRIDEIQCHVAVAKILHIVQNIVRVVDPKAEVHHERIGKIQEEKIAHVTDQEAANDLVEIIQDIDVAENVNVDQILEIIIEDAQHQKDDNENLSTIE